MKSNLLITEKSIHNFVKEKHRAQEDEGKEEIHERLYKEKDDYFKRKNFVNVSRDEIESKLCTFQPNAEKYQAFLSMDVQEEISLNI